MQRARSRLRAAWPCAGAAEPHTPELAAAVSVITGEPVARAHALLQHSAQQTDAFQRDYDWLTAHTWAQTRRHIERCALPQAAELHTALQGIDRPVILACTHAGNYLTGLLRLLCELPDVRALTMIKRPAASEREHRLHDHVAQLGIDVQVLRIAERPLLRALEALRQRRHVALMVDVPPSFGVTGLAPVPLFDHPAHMPEGPAALAVAGRALLLPISVHGPAAAAAVRLGALIDAAPRAQEDRRSATQRVHRALAGQLVDWLRAWPESWMLWPHLPSYFFEPEPSVRHIQRQERAATGKNASAAVESPAPHTGPSNGRLSTHAPAGP